MNSIVPDVPNTPRSARELSRAYTDSEALQYIEAAYDASEHSDLPSLEIQALESDLLARNARRRHELREHIAGSHTTVLMATDPVLLGTVVSTRKAQEDKKQKRSKQKARFDVARRAGVRVLDRVFTALVVLILGIVSAPWITPIVEKVLASSSP